MTNPNNPTRRAVLGAMAVIPAAVALPAAAQTVDRSAWEAAFAAMERAEAAFDPAADNCDEAGFAFCEAQSALIQTPAPDGGALLWKLDALFGPAARDPGDYGGTFCPDWINAVMADARRLLA